MGSVALNERGGWEVYRASKAALNMLMRSYAARHAADHRSLALVDPGWVRTEMGGANASLSIEESIPGVANAIEAQSVVARGQSPQQGMMTVRPKSAGALEPSMDHATMMTHMRIVADMKGMPSMKVMGNTDGMVSMTGMAHEVGATGPRPTPPVPVIALASFLALAIGLALAFLPDA